MRIGARRSFPPKVRKLLACTHAGLSRRGHIPCFPTALTAGRVQLFDEEFRKEFPCVQRWYLTLAHDAHFSAVWGKVQLCEQALKYSEPLPQPIAA